MELKTGQPVKLYTGINSEQFEELQTAARNYREVIIEVEALAIKELPQANPTFKSIRYDRMQPKTMMDIAEDPLPDSLVNSESGCDRDFGKVLTADA